MRFFLLGLLFSCSAFGYGIHCKYTPGELWLDFSGEKVLLRETANPKFELGELQLHPGTTYFYREINLAFDKSGCVQSEANPMQVYCLAPASLLRISSPDTSDTQVKLVVGSVGVEPFKKKGTDYVGYKVTLTFQRKKSDGFLSATAQNIIFFESGCSVNGVEALH